MAQADLAILLLVLFVSTMKQSPPVSACLAGAYMLQYYMVLAMREQMNSTRSHAMRAMLLAALSPMQGDILSSNNVFGGMVPRRLSHF